MSDDDLRGLVRSRKLSAVPTDPDLAKQHADRARTTLEQALLLTDAALQERLRYEAGLHLALALMACDGYRLRSGPGHHETAIAYLRISFAENTEASAAVRVLDMSRRNRNNELYRAVEVGVSTARASAAALDVLVRELDEHLSATDR